MDIRSVASRVVAPVALAAAPFAAQADVYSDIAAGVSFTGAVTGIGLMAVAISVLLIAKKGITIVLGMLRGG